VNAAVDDALTCFGLGPLAHRPVATLSAGDRRLVAVARATCAGFRILLLDEPSSGLDERETGHLAGILRELVNAGLGILLVEHDMALVMNTCERIFVVDFGKLIFAGTPAEVKDSPVVQAAYLGVGVV
jgi:ABC-type branched-subunit amino acid transport system ATPase component